MMTRMLSTAVLAALAGLNVFGQTAGQPAATATTRIPQFENSHVKVWKSTVVPNAPLPLHRHDHGRNMIGDI